MNELESSRIGFQVELMLSGVTPVFPVSPEVESGEVAAPIVTAPEPGGWRISPLKLRRYDSDARNLKVRTPP